MHPCNKKNALTWTVDESANELRSGLNPKERNKRRGRQGEGQGLGYQGAKQRTLKVCLGKSTWSCVAGYLPEVTGHIRFAHF